MDLIRDCLSDIKDDIECLSFVSKDFNNSTRSPWTDYIVYAVLGPEVLEARGQRIGDTTGNISPYAWSSDILIAGIENSCSMLDFYCMLECEFWSNRPS